MPILAFSFPIIVSYLLQQVYTISDAAIVGQTLTAQEVAGVNDTSSLIFIFLQFAFGVSAGFCVVTSCNVGAHNPAGVRRSLTTQIVLSGVLTVVLTALALVLLDPMLAWINVTPDSPEVYRAAGLNQRPSDIRFWLAAVGLFATGVDNTPALLFLQIGVSSRMFALQLVFRRASARNAQ